LKKIVLAVSLVIFAAITLAGCVNEPDFVAEPVVFAKKAPEAPPIPLDQVLANNTAAIGFADEKKDFLEGDKFLTFVNDAKERDAAEETKKTALALQAAVNQAQSALNSEAPAVSSGGTQPTGSNTGSQPSSGGSSSGSGSSGSGGQTTGSGRYFNTASGYSIEFPGGWTKIDTTFSGLQFVGAVSGPSGAGDQFAENIGIAVQELPLELSSAEYLDLTVAGLKATMSDFKELKRRDFTLDGGAGKKLVFSYTLNGRKIKDALYEVVKGFKAYVIVGTAQSEEYSKYSGVFDTCAGTLKFESGK